MSKHSTCDSYLVRIYRIDSDDPHQLAGQVEALDGSGERVPFTDSGELVFANGSTTVALDVTTLRMQVGTTANPAGLFLSADDTPYQAHEPQASVTSRYVPLEDNVRKISRLVRIHECALEKECRTTISKPTIWAERFSFCSFVPVPNITSLWRICP